AAVRPLGARLVRRFHPGRRRRPLHSAPPAPSRLGAPRRGDSGARSRARGRLLAASIAAPGAGYAVGRIGCFLVGDDYGAPTKLPWGVAFPVGLPPTRAGMLRREFHLAGDPLITDD